MKGLKPTKIVYGIHKTPFGLCLIGLANRDICHLSFVAEKDSVEAEKTIRRSWPKSHILRDDAKTQPFADKIFKANSKQALNLLLQGTDFQIKVWEALLQIPFGKTVSYAEIAKNINAPKAVRAVGTACGKNSIGFIIPCHRVLASSGGLGGYRWGVEKKKAILAWESAAQANK